MTGNANVLLSDANAELCLETGTKSHLTVEDESGHGFDTEGPQQRARHCATNNEHIFD
jgi:hypothetical protein